VPVQDFLITFRADTTGALNQINALAKRVSEVDAALNTTMSRLNQRVTGGGPLANITQGAGGAARSINQINAGFLQMGRNVSLTTEDVQNLLARLQLIKQTFSRDVRGGFGASINQGQLKEAIRIITQLKDAQHLSAQEARKWGDELTAAYAKAARVPVGLRGLPVEQQAKAMRLMAREVRQATDLEAARQPVGGVRNIQGHQRALENYIRTVRELGQFSLATAGDLDKLEAELLQVRAASSLQSQKGANDRTVRGLREQASVIRNRQATVTFGTNPAAELRDMRQLERVLQDLQSRGDPVQRELDETRTKIQQLSAAAALATQRIKELNTTQNLQSKVADLTGKLQGRFANVQQELTATRQLERALFKLEQRGEPVSRQLQQVRADVDRLAAAANRAKSLDTLLRRRASLDTRIESRSIRTNQTGQDRDLVRAAMRNEEALSRLGDPKAASRLQVFRQQFASLPPVIDAATARMQEFNRSLQQKVLNTERFNLPQLDARTLMGGLQNGLDMMKAGLAEGGQAVDFFGERVGGLPPTLDRVAQGMLNHGRRVAEGLFIYEALGRAMQAVGEQIQLVNNLAREQIRFAAVAGGLGDQGSSGFLLGLQDIAVRTNTPMDELAAQIDTVAAVMLEAGDATQVAAASTEFLNQAGQFTNITQRDLASETKNLLGIYNQTGDSVGEFADRLGRITVAGRNNSAIISGITDVLSEAGATARSTGFDFDLLASLGGQMVQDLLGTMEGGEIGGLLNTVIGRLNDPQIRNKIRDLSDGLISFTDANGKLRDSASVLLDIFTILEDGSEVKALVLDQVIPPLSPGRRALIEDTLGRNLPEAVADMGRIMGATAEDATNLSEALVSGPGERFAAAMKEVSGAMVGIFSEEIIGLGNQFADILRTIATLLGAGQPGGGFAGGLAGAATQFIILIALAKTLTYVGRNLALMFGAGRIRAGVVAADIANLNTATTTGAPLVGAYGSKVANVGTQAQTASTKVGALRGVIGGLARALSNPLTLIIAIELLQNIPDVVDSWKAQFDSELSSGLVDRDVLNFAFAELGNIEALGVDLTSIARLDFIFGNAAAGATKLSEIQFQNVENLARAMIQLQKEGKLTAEAQKVLDAAITASGGGIKDQLVPFEDLIAAYNTSILATEDLSSTSRSAAGSWGGYTEGVDETTEALDDLTDAERRAQDAMVLNAGLSDARAQALLKLTDQLRAGSITVDEWAEGQQNAAQATEAAASFIAAYGTQLNLIPGLQERVAQSGETAAEALVGMLLDNPDTIAERIGILEAMVEIAETNEEVAANLEANPITPRIDNETFNRDREVSDSIKVAVEQGWVTLHEVVDRNPVRPQLDLSALKAQAIAALKIYQTMIAASKTVRTSMDPRRQGITSGAETRAGAARTELNSLNAAIAELERAGEGLANAGAELSGLGDAFNVFGGIRGDDPRLESSASDGEREPAQTTIVDIGDLPASAIQQIIALATAAQNQVVGAGGVVDTDETAAIFKDAAFQTLIQGVDQRFLQQAIEELTEVERKRLELEQARLQDVTRSLVTQVGPIQSITSAPVLAAGGGILSGQGLNADPRLGNFTINVPINWSGMSLTQLQEFIYKSVSQAWIDAGRGA
jgi:hypothetical protein